MTRARLPVVSSPHAECERGQPCPWVSCRYHLWRERAEDDRNDVDALVEAIGDADATCALDVARKGAQSMEYVATLLGVTDTTIMRVEQFGRAAVGGDFDRDDFEDHPEDPYVWYQNATDEDVYEAASELRRQVKAQRGKPKGGC